MATSESPAPALATPSHQQNTDRPSTPEPLGTSSRPSKYFAIHTGKSATTSPAMTNSALPAPAEPAQVSTTRPEQPLGTDQATPATPTPKADEETQNQQAPSSPGQELRSTTGHVIKTALHNPTRKRRKDTWVYAPIEDEGEAKEARAPVTLEDEFKLATKAATDDGSGKRAARRTLTPGTYNENKRQRLYVEAPKTVKRKKQAKHAASGKVVVDGEALDTPARAEQDKKALDEAFDMGWTMEPSAERGDDDNKVQRSESRLSRVGLVARATANAMAASVSSLGKRSREAVEELAGRRQSTLDQHFRPRPRGEPSPKKARASTPQSPRATRTSPRTSPRRVKAGSRSSARLKDSPLKRARHSIAEASKSAVEEEKEVKRKPAPVLKKKWLSAGIYVGQDPDFNVRFTDAANIAKKANKSADSPRKNAYLPEPMFNGKALLELGRNFRLPFDIYSPLMERQPKPDEWKKTRRNVFIGDSASVWKKSKSLPDSLCNCVPAFGCDENCLNRLMFYECDEKNCALGKERCGNRAFADLKERVKRGKKYDIGVEVMKTEDKGFGVRSCRTFQPNQIIVEYSGEIITQDECERRMLNEYKKNECYYLMIFHQNMIIDATRGSIARFVNHSCEPNCRMVKWTVAGEPRMALFAGDHGIMTGEELTYDYNFDPFSQKNVQTCHCGTKSCRGVLGPKLSKEKQNAAESVLAGTKRKLSKLVRGGKKGKTIIKKRQMKATTGNRMKLKTPKKRVMTKASAEKAVVEKENMVITSSRSSTASSTSSNGRQTAKARRNTIQVLSRTASKLKVGVSKKQKVQSSKSTTAKPFKPIGKLAFEDEDDDAIIISPSKLRNALTPKGAQNRQAVKGSSGKGVVKSIKGPRRSLAAAKMGLPSKASVGRSVRVVDDSD